jgi:hypothetical protein
LGRSQKSSDATPFSPAGHTPFLRQFISRSKHRCAAKCDASGTLPRKKFKTIKPFLAKILIIPMF